jgi:Fungal specific transcription factor domain./Fungal Zn(2)-Cys(6) binuclear cluster domain.
MSSDQVPMGIDSQQTLKGSIGGNSHHTMNNTNNSNTNNNNNGNGNDNNSNVYENHQVGIGGTNSGINTGINSASGGNRDLLDKDSEDVHNQFNDFDQSPNHYLDSNWASSLLMDPSSDMLYSMDLGNGGGLPRDFQASSHSSNPIMQSIQFQNNIHSDNLVHNADKSTQEKDEIPIETKIENPPKSKARRPCDHCRRRKTKCVIIPNTSNCVQCESKSVTCTYTIQAMKRKATDMDSPSNKRKNDTPDPNNMSLQDKNAIVPPNVPIRDVAPIQDYSVMSNSLLKKTLSLQFPRSSFYVGPTSYLYDVSLLNLIIDSQNKAGVKNSKSGPSNLNKIEQVNLSPSISLRKVSDTVQFVLKDDQSPQSYQSMSNDVDTIEKFIAPHGQILIDLYFRIIHPSYPILHKKVFLEKYSRTHREFSAPLLAAVYVLAIQWWDYDPQLNRFPKPNVELILKIGLNNYLLEILKRPKLSAVQAGLLLLQCKHIINEPMRKDSSETSLSAPHEFEDSDYSDWVLCSQVVALAEELGLGLDCNNWKLPKWERGLRKRLAWAVYMEDKWLALKNARPSHIQDINWVVVSLIKEDFPEKHGDGDLKEGSSDIDNGKKIFMNFIELSMVLSDILNQFYSMRAMIEITDVSQVLKLAKPLQLKLREWYHSLPAELQMTSVQPRKLCSNGYLQLAYFATELSLHRKISTVIYQQSMAGNPPPPELVKVCRTAAKTRLLGSIEFVRDLKPEHIHSFWHSSAASNFTLIGTFAAILFMSSPSKEEADFYRDQIFNYRWILKISSKGFDQVGEALLKLDLVLNQIPGLLNDSVELPMVIPNVPNVSTEHRQQSQNQSQNQSHPQSQEQSRTSVSSRHSLGQSSQNQARASPNLYSNEKNPSSTQRMRMGPQQQLRMNSQLNIHQGNSPYNSPQNFNTPPFSQSNNSNNSPQSSQGLSPKDIIKHQRLMSNSGLENQKPQPIYGPKSAIRSPNSNTTQQNTLRSTHEEDGY